MQFSYSVERPIRKACTVQLTLNLQFFVHLALHDIMLNVHLYTTLRPHVLQSFNVRFWYFSQFQCADKIHEVKSRLKIKTKSLFLSLVLVSHPHLVSYNVNVVQSVFQISGNGNGLCVFCLLVTCKLTFFSQHISICHSPIPPY